ncbi:MAG TPA: ATP-binding protein [Steroidobacteraceae bacterium]|nr:ATP-binding protein [Steroidobacteraceae bacterium]
MSQDRSLSATAPDAQSAPLSELEALTHLYEVGNRCLRAGNDVDGCLAAILDAAILVTGADKGMLHLLDPQNGGLVIRAQRGFDRRFLDYFSHVHDRTAAACGAALASAARVAVEDVTRSEIFADQTSLDVLLAQGVRAVQSTPLISSAGRVFGMVSTHFAKATLLGQRELRFMDLLARQAADYAERKQAEQHARERERQLERITAHAGTCISQCSRELRYLFANKPLAEFLGRTPEQIVGQSIPEIIGEAAFKKILPYIDRVLSGERVEYEAEVPYVYPGPRHVHGVYVPEVNAQGWVCGWTATVTDVTERKRLEVRLRAADRQKDEFLAMLAHELRNPLAPIRYALATTQKSGRTAEQQARAEAVIERQVAHMTRLLDDLLDVSRITRDKIELKKAATDLTSILGIAMEAARPALDAKRHTLSLDLPKQLVRLEVDSARLAQVFSNLLINAAKYTDPGGHIELRAREEEGELVVSVRDNGVGISAELLPRLFTLFTQSRATVGRSEGGLGIGLALVRGIVELHGGSVQAHSDGSNRGSEFTVRLPLGTAEAPLQEDGAGGRKPLRLGLKILIADDNRDAADTCATLLELSGHHVQIAYSSRGALELAETFRPDALLLDIGLPDMSGYELAERIRSAVWGKSAVLVAVTGFGQEEDRSRAFAAGFDHHLTKPVTGAALVALIESVSDVLSMVDPGDLSDEGN